MNKNQQIGKKFNRRTLFCRVQRLLQHCVLQIFWIASMIENLQHKESTVVENRTSFVFKEEKYQLCGRIIPSWLVAVVSPSVEVGAILK